MTIEEEVFVGHGVMFTNDPYPQAVNEEGTLKTEADWTVVKTRVQRRAAIGSNATIMAGVTIGESPQVGAGAAVTHDVADFAIVPGVPILPAIRYGPSLVCFKYRFLHANLD